MEINFTPPKVWVSVLPFCVTLVENVAILGFIWHSWGCLCLLKEFSLRTSHWSQLCIFFFSPFFKNRYRACWSLEEIRFITVLGNSNSNIHRVRPQSLGAHETEYSFLFMSRNYQSQSLIISITSSSSLHASPQERSLKDYFSLL